MRHWKWILLILAVNKCWNELYGSNLAALAIFFCQNNCVQRKSWWDLTLIIRKTFVFECMQLFCRCNEIYFCRVNISKTEIKNKSKKMNQLDFIWERSIWMHEWKCEVNVCHSIQVFANIWHCKHAIRMNHSELLTVAILAMH